MKEEKGCGEPLWGDDRGVSRGLNNLLTEMTRGQCSRARRWQGRGPGPGVLEEHLRRVWLQWVSKRETGSGGGQGPRGQLGGRPELKEVLSQWPDGLKMKTTCSSYIPGREFLEK